MMPTNSPNGQQPDLRNVLSEMCGDDRLLFLSGFDDCILGLVSEYGRVPRVAYDVDLLFQRLRQMGIPEDQIEQVFENQIATIDKGPYSPALIITPPANCMPHRN